MKTMNVTEKLLWSTSVSFFSDSLLDHIVHQTVLYSVQQRPAKPLQLTRNELENFIGVKMYMSLLKMSNSRSYWSPEFRIHKIADTMTVNKFKEIKKYLHFCDNSIKSDDKLQKVRPVNDSVLENCKYV